MRVGTGTVLRKLPSSFDPPEQHFATPRMLYSSPEFPTKIDSAHSPDSAAAILRYLYQNMNCSPRLESSLRFRGGREDASESAAPLHDPKGTVIDRVQLGTFNMHVRFVIPALPEMSTRVLPGSNGSSNRAN